MSSVSELILNTSSEKRIITSHSILRISFKMPDKISREIRGSLIVRENHKYEVQSKISDEIFPKFLQYLIDGTEPEIYFDTIYKLNQLSKEFQINEIQEKIEKKRKQWREIENYFE